MLFVFRYFWLLAVIATAANVLSLNYRARRYVREHPHLADGYRRLVLGYLFWGSLPWVAMGAAIELGGVPSTLSFFRPGDGNPLVLAWFTLVIVWWFIGFLWIFVWRGAEFLVEHPGVFSYDIKNPAIIKALYCLIIGVGVIAVYMMFAHPVAMLTE